MRVAVLTTSYPRFSEDAAGRFVADAVEHVRDRGIEVEVVGPEQFRNYGIAYGHGVVGNLRRRPWLALFVPALLASFVRAARRVEADLLHAHWLPAGWVAARARRPYVVQVWGTDVELARYAPRLARLVLREARLVIAASTALADEARRLGAGKVRMIPSGVDLPSEIGEEAEPLEVVEAARGMKLVVAGDGPVRSRVPGALGFVTHDELQRLYRRAAVVACPSRREGFGVTCLEAMAHARPVVATGVGGLRDLVVDGETGLVVPPHDIASLRAALERLLADPHLRRRYGAAGRERARERFSWATVTDATLEAYAEAMGRMTV